MRVTNAAITNLGDQPGSMGTPVPKVNVLKLINRSLALYFIVILAGKIYAKGSLLHSVLCNVICPNKSMRGWACGHGPRLVDYATAVVVIYTVTHHTRITPVASSSI